MKHLRFGRYLILDHLVDGGMAKISRALYLAEQVDKLVAIKMVKQELSQDESFKKMFMDEIKVTFGLVHPNIIQTYDYGDYNQQLYVVMEYCEGRNIKEYMNKLNSQNTLFPVEISTYVMAQACMGLHYAHNYLDKLTGKSANIIHRDISPQNIMINFDGGVKVIDFGIAKAATNSEATKTGTIKGKLSYLAPEYIEGATLDPRYDEFAIGITLWEMLCGKKLFSHPNDIEVLKMIQRCNIPAPSSINPAVPKELDEIVLKALSKNRENRYPDLDFLNKALMKFLNSHYPDFYQRDLTDLAQLVFFEDIRKDRNKMREFAKIDPRPYLEELKLEIESISKNPDPTAVTELTERFTPLEIEGGVSLKREVEFNLEDAKNILVKVPEKTKTGVRKKEGPKTQTFRYESESLVSESKRKSQSNSLGAWIFIIAGISLGYYFYNKKANLNLNKVNKVEIKKVVAVEEVKPPPPPPLKSIQLNNFDIKRMQVFVEGNKSNSSTVGEIKAPIGKEITVRVQTEGRSHYIMPMKIDPKDSVELEVPEMPAAAYGYLVTNDSCPQGELSYEIYGENRVSPIPLPKNINGIGFPLKSDLDDNWAPVVYEVTFTSANKKMVKQLEIHIQREDQNVDLCELLDQSLKKK